MPITITRQLIAEIRALLRKRERPYQQVLKWNRNQARGPKGSPTGGQWVKGGGSASMYGTRILPSSTEINQMPQGLPKVRARGRQAGREGAASRERREARDAAEAEAERRGGGVAGYASIMNAPTGEGFRNRPRANFYLPPALVTADSKVLTVLKNGSVTDSRPLGGGGCNSSVIVTMDDGTEAVYKPERGENWTASFCNGEISDYITNRDFSLAEREAFAFEVDTALGLGIVPETVLRERVDETNINVNTSGDDDDGGDYYGDSDELRSQYERYKEKALQSAYDDVGGEMDQLYRDAQKDHAKEIDNRAQEILDIWNEEAKDFPESPYGSGSVMREHPVLPLGSKGPFERREDKGVLDPIEVMDEANVDVEYKLNADEEKRVREVIRKKLAEGYQEYGDIDPDRAEEHLDRDQWIENHQDTENRLLESKIQGFETWRQENHPRGSGGGGSGEDRNPDAPHPQGGSFQNFRGNADSYGDMNAEDGARLAVLDYVIGTMDRHPQNLMFENDRPIAIDNGYSMPGGMDEPDSFTFRSSGVSDWLSSWGSRNVPSDLRAQLHESMQRTDWQALADRHPNMSRDEREAFLGRTRVMTIALQTEEGLRGLWKGLNRM